MRRKCTSRTAICFIRMENYIFVLPYNPTKCEDDCPLGEGNAPDTDEESAPM